jgi:hypothetical protein
MLRRTLLTTGVLVGVLFAMAAPSFGGSGGGVPGGGSLQLVDGDGGVPMFRMTGMAVGDAPTRCTTVRNAGTRPATTRLFAHVGGHLPRRLQVEITRGRLPVGLPFPSCAGFVPAADVDRGLGPGVLYRGSMARLPRRFGAGIRDPGPWLAGATRAYRFTVTLVSLPKGRHHGATVVFVWRARGI